MRQKLAITNIYDVLLNKESEFFHLNDAVHVYDRMRMYFCSAKLDDKEFEIPVAELTADTQTFLFRPHVVNAVLKYVGPVDFNDVKDPDNKRTVEIYLDAIFCQSQLDM